MSKVSTHMHFPLGRVWGLLLFFNKAVKDFELGLDSILIHSVKIAELDTFFEDKTMYSLVSSRFLCRVSTNSNISKQEFAPSINFHKSWCQARVILLPVPLAGKVSVSKLINYFPSHPAAFEFWASSPPGNTTLIPTTKKTDRVFLIFN